MHLQMNSTLSFSYIFSAEKDRFSWAQTSFILNGLVLPTSIFIFRERAIKQLKYSSTIPGVRIQLKHVQSLQSFHSQNKDNLLEPLLFFINQYYLNIFSLDLFKVITRNQPLIRNQWTTLKKVFLWNTNWKCLFF